MGVYHGYSEDGWARKAATTLAKHIPEVEDTTLRNHKFLALLQSKGQMIFNDSGNGFDWNVKIKKPNVKGFNGREPISFDRKNLHEVANLAWRGYYATESMTEAEFLENRGSKEQIVNVFGNMIEELESAMKQRLPLEVFVDGAAAGNEQSWHGLETLFGYTGTLNSTDGTQRVSPNAADLVAYPTGTYGSLSTELGHFGGEQYASPNNKDSIWPNYLADPEFDCWSPLIVNYTSTGFAGTTATWKEQGKQALSFAITHAQRNSTLEEQATQLYMARDLWIGFIEDLREKERIMTSSSLGLRALGFKDVVEWDGVECTWDSAVPIGDAYLVPLGQIQLRCLREKLLHPEGPHWDFKQRTYDAALTTLSNLKFKSPRNFAKLSPIA